MTVSATLVHPLIEIRLPTLAQTSASATPEGCPPTTSAKIRNAVPVRLRTPAVVTAPLAQQRRPLTTLPDVGQGLTNRLDVGLLLRIGTEVTLHVVA